ncbi:phosphopantetheine-binding protein [Clostridium sp.]|uniref:phosphopantetheine-binding protein n=1 Tax=Clostridium sp. TaxID=1506 RepID=UPI00261E9904|nr:phosphopantetheine-binding protein [Clostridium sp.]
MKLEESEKIVLKILKSLVKNIKNINLDSKLQDDLGMDSIKLISLAVELAQKTNVDMLEISEKVDFSKIITVRDVVIFFHEIKAKQL